MMNLYKLKLQDVLFLLTSTNAYLSCPLQYRYGSNINLPSNPVRLLVLFLFHRGEEMSSEKGHDLPIVHVPHW